MSPTSLTIIKKTNVLDDGRITAIPKSLLLQRWQRRNRNNISDFKNGGLKNVDINKKISSLQCSWIKRLYDDSFHEWKLIPLKLIKKSFGDELKFHSNLSFNNSYVRLFPRFVEGAALARVFFSVGFPRFLGASFLQSPSG